MKKNLFILTITIVLLSFSTASFTQDFKVDIFASIESLDNAPSYYYVYEKPTKKDIAAHNIKLWNNLNKYADARLNLELLKNQGTRIHIKTKNSLFHMYSPAAMGFLYSKPLGDYLRPKDTILKSNHLLSKEQAAITAMDYLSKLKILPEEPNEMYIDEVSTIRGAASNGSEIYDFLQVVRFNRKLNGFKVIGPTRIIIRLAGDGELVSVIKNWPGLIKKNLKTKNNIHEKAKWENLVVQYLENQYADVSDCYGINIKEIELVMYDDGAGCIEPALYAKGKWFDTNQYEFSGDWFIPVLVEPKAHYENKGPGSRDDQDSEEIR